MLKINTSSLAFSNNKKILLENKISSNILMTNVLTIQNYIESLHISVVFTVGIYIYLSLNCSIILFNVSACAINSSLAAALSSAVAEFD